MELSKINILDNNLSSATPCVRQAAGNVDILLMFGSAVMLKIIFLFTVLVLLGLGFACGGSTGIAGDTPTEAYKRLYAAVKSKNVDAIKKQLTKRSIEFGLSAAQRQNTPPDKVFENGFSASTFSETLPPMRDERVKGDMGAIEVWNAKDSRWDDTPFMREDGAWKLAVGDVFGKVYVSPGKGRDQLEKEAANAMATPTPITPVNMNSAKALSAPALPLSESANASKSTKPK